MATLLRQHWQPDLSVAGLSRRDRQGCDYDAYLPDPLEGRAFALDGDVAADVADAEAAITRLNLEATALVDSEALARLLLRAEAVASSRIEGLEVGSRRLLRAELTHALGGAHADVTAEEVLGNINAMRWAIDSLAAARTVTVDGLLEVHRRLLEGTPRESHGGRVRIEQNWIGGSRFNPCGAAFVPPPPGAVPALLDDLCRFCSGDSLPAIVQAAVAHAQFETIHPFADGNGRTGRALIQVVLRRRRLAPRILPPISLVLATWSDDYVRGLGDTRYLGDASSGAAHQGLNRWIAFFAAASRRAVDDVNSYEERIRDLQESWRERAGRVRRGSAADLLLATLPGTPIVTVASAAAAIARTVQATNVAVARLAEAGVLQPVSLGRRNRAFEAAGLLDAFTDLERQLASPDGDTRTSRPVRVVPRRGGSRGR